MSGMPPNVVPAVDGELMPLRSNDQDWLTAWHPGPLPPAGTPHGAAGVCLTEAGELVLVRSYWRADVEVLPWEPRFEIQHRRVVTATEAPAHVRDPDEAATRISHRALLEAGVT